MYRSTNPVRKVSRKAYYLALSANTLCCLAFAGMLIWFIGLLLPG